MCVKYAFNKNPPNHEIGETGSLYVKTPKDITNSKQIRAESIRFNNVVYCASPELKHKLKVILLVRAVLPKRKEMTEKEPLENIFSKLKEERLVSSTYCMLF